MDTKPLEHFATQARRDLLAAVDARATAVLSPGSVARSERAEAVKRLEFEIAAHGRPHVIDKVAYTWFNRIIALRFMDARGYTDAGVVSPALGQAHGQPEILADAKRGNLDTDVVGNKYATDAINGLLDGTRRSSDPEGEAYALLLTEYCRHWHKSMPFMFEREGDYTELLVPTGLLADGSILSRAREVLTEEVCDDVEIIGWLYQFYISERKQEIFDSRAKRGAADIPAATQLFTPHWIVRYLVENSLGRIWMLNRPTSRVVDRMDYYIVPVEEETDFLTITGPEELTVIDPACGSGHMLTYAFDLLYAIYEEEGYAPSEIPGLILTHNLYGTEIDPRAGALAAFALTMKARAKQRTFLTKQVEPKIRVIEPISFDPEELDFLATKGGDRNVEEAFWNQFEHADTLGSLIQPDPGVTARLAAHLQTFADDGDILHGRTIEHARIAVAQASALARKYSIAVANPPYMSSATMDARLTDFSCVDYPRSKADLFAMFIERSLSLVVSRGLCAMVTMQSWMFLASFETLRRHILDWAPVQSMLHLGTGAFDTISGAVVSTSAFVLQREASADVTSVFVNLTNGRSEAEKRAQLRGAIEQGENVFNVRPQEFLVVPRSPITYSLNERAVFGRPSIGSVMASGGRLKTHGNAKYVRYHWEIDSSAARWRPFHNGGGQAAYYGNDEEVVDWSAAAVAEYERHGGLPKAATFDSPGVTWSMVGAVENSFRLRNASDLFSSASPTLVASSAKLALAYCAALNTPTMAALLWAINPTINNYVADVVALPQLEQKSLDTLYKIGEAGLENARDRSSRSETSRMFLDFGKPVHGLTLQAWIKGETESLEATLVSEGALRSEAEYVVASDFGVTPRSVFVEDGVPDGYISERIRGVVSVAVGSMFGRFSPDEPGPILTTQGATLQDYLAKVPSPSFLPDADNVIPFVDDGWFEDDVAERFREFLRIAFGAEHFEENLRFVEESLGVRALRDYFITKSGKSKFYDDHVQRYKKRPIYWMFSSPKGSFNALIYMHRYNPSTVSTVLNEYLREYTAKLEVALANAEQSATNEVSAKAQKEADRLRKVLAELRDYDHDVLYPLATQQIVIDLDDGVKANYPKFYPALKKISGLEAPE
ncbi:BREX-1 system adenine-specific DNA-methyltransferase PglX [Tessaracoccus sp. Y36]